MMFRGGVVLSSSGYVFFTGARRNDGGDADIPEQAKGTLRSNLCGDIRWANPF
jgi:hypothetical protein